MVAVTLDILKEIRPRLRKLYPSAAFDKKTLENMELIFVGKFWFSNLAWLNEAKRFFKI